jgi:phosphatidylinositol glycan class M
MGVEHPTIGQLVMLSAVVHAAFLAFGLWQDEAAAVKYTDVDYQVFTDAARHVYKGGSPYARHTYRYTPILAYMMVGNVAIAEWLGKVVFSIFDLATGKLIYDLTDGSRMWASMWLFSPIAINVATRGSCDAMICCLMLLFIKYFQKNNLDKAAIVLGLAVHFRLFPVVFGLPVLWRLRENRKIVRFVSISAVVFLTLLGLSYKIYGYEFLHETYLYHFTRKDHRHNFSFLFYPTYLSGGVTGASAAASASSSSSVVSTLIPQLGGLVLVGSLNSRSLPVTALLQTLVFVAFNRVITAQYFVWYGCLIPLALPHIANKRPLVLVLLVWLAAKLHWLFWAYKLEMEGLDVFWAVHIASLIFFWTHMALICVLIHSTSSNTPSLDKKVDEPPTASVRTTRGRKPKT